jgi:hypothetical protein
VASEITTPEPAILELISRQPPDCDIRNVKGPEFAPTGSGIDPFNTLPPPRSPRTQVLLYHGIAILSPGDWSLEPLLGCLVDPF